MNLVRTSLYKVIKMDTATLKNYKELAINVNSRIQCDNCIMYNRNNSLCPLFGIMKVYSQNVCPCYIGKGVESSKGSEVK